MLATPDQVGERLVCPDCETPAIVPPPEEVVSHAPQPVTPSRDPNDVYDISQPGPAPSAHAAPAPRSYIAAICPVCHTRLDVTEDKVGTIIECPDCGTRFAVHRPKAAPPQPNPLDEIGEEYGVAPPMEVAQRKPAVMEPGDLVIDSEEHRTVEERRGLEEEWKNFNQQLRSGWQASPTPAAAVAAAVAASAEPEKEPTESFFSGVFTFPFYRSSIAYWVALSLGLMFVVLPPTFAYMMAIKQTGGPEWTWVIVASALACIAGLIWILMTSSSCLAILQDTAEGCDEVENWPEGQIFEWLFDAAYILTALLLATAAGLTVSRLLVWIGHPWWPSAIVVGWVMFPFILVSMLEAGSPLLPFSVPIVRSLLLAWWAWFLFYLETTLLVAVVGGLGAAVTVYTHHWGSPVAIVLAVAVLMIYFRLVGRLIWFCSHEGVLEDEDKPQRTDDKLLHKRSADVE
jgi:DNA-directed RNA polymerase subunit RPC12/RpoP